MPNKAYIRGTKFERDIQHELESHFPGSEAYRTAGSHGSFDVIHVDKLNKRISFIQAKTKLSDDPCDERMLSPEKGWCEFEGRDWSVVFVRYTKEIKITKANRPKKLGKRKKNK